jgi:sulfate adenylyltransferase subunit 1
LEIGGKEVEAAFAPQSVVIHLSEDIDIGRGDSIVKTGDHPIVSNEAEVLLCWMDEKPLKPGNKYYLQQNSRLVRTVIKSIDYKIDVNTLNHQPVEGEVRLNEVVKATIKTASPLVFDPYDRISANGSAILIDETSNSTVAAVLFQQPPN